MIPTVCADLIKRYVTGGYFENEAKAVDGLSEYVENTMTAKDTSYGKETTQWLFNDSTKVGDTTYYCDEENGFIYLFIKTGTPKLDETSVYSVRHLLVTPGDNSKDSSTSSTEKKYTKKSGQLPRKRLKSCWHSTTRRTRPSTILPCWRRKTAPIPIPPPQAVRAFSVV